MRYLDLSEPRQHGTPDFPFEYHYIDRRHPRYVMNYHWHPEYELVRVLNGAFHMTLDEKRFTLRPGELVFVHGGTLHAGTPEAGSVYECLVFDLHGFSRHCPACVPYIQQIVDRSTLVCDRIPTQYHGVHLAADCVFSAMRDAPPGFELSVIGELYRMFGLIFSEHLYLDTVPQDSRRDIRRVRLKHVLDYIDHNFASQVTLGQLAEVASMSPKYFCRFFYRMTHYKPIDYLNMQRVEHACYALATAERSVTDVAYSCGFNDLSYFIKTFKRYKGVTPGKYQRWLPAGKESAGY